MVAVSGHQEISPSEDGRCQNRLVFFSQWGRVFKNRDPRKLQDAHGGQVFGEADLLFFAGQVSSALGNDVV